MKTLPGIAFGFLVGCTLQPPAVPAGPTPNAATADQLVRLQRAELFCLGVEHLPPAATENPIPALVPVAAAELALRTPPALPRTSTYQPFGGLERLDRHTWLMSQEDLIHACDPMAREVLQFLDDVMGEDRRRLRRSLGTPILTTQASDLQSPGIELAAEEAQTEDKAQWLAENGMSLLRRPLHLLLRRTPLVKQLEVDLDEWKASNAPLSADYSRVHEERDLGRLSMRLHLGEPVDPVELVYMHSGVRIGSSQDTFKCGFTGELARDVMLEVRTRREYERASWHFRADLSWRMSPRASLHLVAGDTMDFLATSTVYSLFESPMDGAPGLLLYAVHLF